MTSSLREYIYHTFSLYCFCEIPLDLLRHNIIDASVVASVRTMIDNENEMLPSVELNGRIMKKQLKD